MYTSAFVSTCVSSSVSVSDSQYTFMSSVFSCICFVYDVVTRPAVATDACSVTRSLKLSNVERQVSTWMGDRQGRLSAVNLCPFVGVDHNLRPYSRYRADTDVNQSKENRVLFPSRYVALRPIPIMLCYVTPIVPLRYTTCL